MLCAEDTLLADRKVFFNEEVTPESAVQLIQILIHLEKQDPGKEIKIYLNSPGGDVTSGLAVYDTIVGLKCPVRTVCLGTAASMGSIIFLAGKHREILPHAEVMVHDPLISGLKGAQKALALEKEAEKLMKTREIIAKIISERTGHTLQEVYDITKEDHFFDAEEALAYGLATEIVDHV